MQDNLQPTKLPTVSIVMYARSEPETIEENLPSLLRQDYPQQFEVIIVNEGPSVEMNMAVKRLQQINPNIYLTFTPDGARNLSRKKLALTLGVKAAKGDVILVSDVTVRAESPNWLSSMMRHFSDPETQIVIGYGTPEVPDTSMLGRKTRMFDWVADSVTWLSSAISKSPYRACGFNVAYQRKLFFDNKGFSRSLNLRDGDDDIFINEISNRWNTAVELSDDSMIVSQMYPFMGKTYEYRLSHTFTGQKLPQASRRIMGIGECCMWIAILAAMAGAWFSDICNAAGWIIAGVLILATLLTVGISWRKTMNVFCAPSMSFALPFQAMTRPIRNIFANLNARFGHTTYFTWQ